MSDSCKVRDSGSEWFDDDTTDRELTPMDMLAKRLKGMTCVKLDDGAWWDED